MSAPDGAGSRFPLRTAGFALLSVAALAALIGVATLVTAGTDTTAAPPPATTTSAMTAAPSPTTSSRTSMPVIPKTPTTTPVPPQQAPATPSPPGTAAPTPPPPTPMADLPAASPKGAVMVRVYNNSTIKGLAARAGQDIAAAGWNVVEIGNYAAGTVAASTVYYQEGQREAAVALGEQFGLRVEPRFAGIRNAPPGLIVIVARDYAG